MITGLRISVRPGARNTHARPLAAGWLAVAAARSGHVSSGSGGAGRSETATSKRAVSASSP